MAEKVPQTIARILLVAGVLMLTIGMNGVQGETLFSVPSTGWTTNPDANNIGGGFHLTGDNCTRLYNERTNNGAWWNGAGSPPTGTTGYYEGFYRHLSSDGQSLGTVTLNNVGDVLTVTFSWRIYSIQGDQNNTVALFGVNSTSEVSPGTNPPANPAYRVVFSLNGSTSAEAAVQKTAWNNTTNPSTIAIPSGWALNAIRTLQMRLERTGVSEMTVRLSDLTNSASPVVLHELVDTGDILTSFNTLVMAVRNESGADYNQTRIYSISADFTPVQAATPLISPAGGYFIDGTPVTISCGTSNANIYFTRNGEEPTQEDEHYTVPITVSPGQTICAKAWATGFAASQSATAAFKTFYPLYISRADNSVNVDGDLSEWMESEFTSLGCNYFGAPQVQNAAFAVRWNGETNQFYVAVKVKDLHPVFTDGYTDWNLQDGIEVYVHTTGDGDLDYEDTQASAQQYVLGLNAMRTIPSNPVADLWTTFAGSDSITTQEKAQIGFQAAGVEEFDQLGVATGWVSYEVQMTAYHFLDKATPANSEISPLSLGDVVGVDVNVGDKYGTTETWQYGMKSENTLKDKHMDWSHIGLHRLGMHPADFNGDGKFSSSDIDLLFVQVKNGLNDPDYDLTGDNLVTQADMDVLVLTLCRSRYGDANGDGSVDVGDLGILAANYGGASKTWNLGDFNGDGSVDVGDLGILAANYGASRSSFEADFAKVFGAASVDEEESSNSLCSGLGLPMIVGLALMGLMLVKLEE